MGSTIMQAIWALHWFNSARSVREEEEEINQPFDISIDLIHTISLMRYIFQATLLQSIQLLQKFHILIVNLLLIDEKSIKKDRELMHDLR